MTKKFSSKVSYGLLTIVFIVFFSPLIVNLIEIGINLKLSLLGLFLLIFFGFITHMFLKTLYIIEDNKLKVKCGFFNYKPIDVNEIKEISKSSNFMSSPAPSFDRIEIKYGNFEEMIISPKDKFEFVRYLTSLNPNIINNLTKK